MITLCAIWCLKRQIDSGKTIRFNGAQVMALMAADAYLGYLIFGGMV